MKGPIPAPHERLSLAQAGLLFDPPRTRRAVDQLIRRGVLEGWQIDGALYTTVDALREYAASAKHHPKFHDPSTPDAQLQERIRVLQSVIYEQSQEIARLKIALAEARARRWTERSEEHAPIDEARRYIESQPNPFELPRLQSPAEVSVEVSDGRDRP